MIIIHSVFCIWFNTAISIYVSVGFYCHAGYMVSKSVSIPYTFMSKYILGWVYICVNTTIALYIMTICGDTLWYHFIVHIQRISWFLIMTCFGYITRTCFVLPVKFIVIVVSRSFSFELRFGYEYQCAYTQLMRVSVWIVFGRIF